MGVIRKFIKKDCGDGSYFILYTYKKSCKLYTVNDMLILKKEILKDFPHLSSKYIITEVNDEELSITFLAFVLPDIDFEKVTEE